MTNMNLLHVDQEKCTRCGVCAAVCPGSIINMGQLGPEIVYDLCVDCGHCVAACPHAALNNVNTPLVNQTLLQKTPILDADAAAQFLRARRSIRNYQPKAVPREKILQMLDIARMAPTACNSQGIVYHVVDDPFSLRQIADVVIDWAEGELRNPQSATAVSRYAQHLALIISTYRQTGQGGTLRSAPCLVVAAADKALQAPGRDNAYLALAYAQLYAPSIGLGTCWAGLFEYCAASGYEPLLAVLKLPEHMQVMTGMMVGYPEYMYQRLVDRNPLAVTWQ